ncbi:CTP synthase 2, partial [Dichanthelium oligosanthes]
LVCRSLKELGANVKEKLSQFCHVPVLIVLLWWQRLMCICILVTIAIIGKYTALSDAYLSVVKALMHASLACHRKIIFDLVYSTDLEDSAAKESPEAYNAARSSLRGADGILVPGGFGDRGTAGKILAAKFLVKTLSPILDSCSEIDPDSKILCVIFMPEGSKTHMGGTMRLGSRSTFFKTTDCKSARLYGNVNYVDERHRHRYEVNPDMVPLFENAGLQFVGRDETGRRMEDLLLHRLGSWSMCLRRSATVTPPQLLNVG